jgi:hypothetical protein
VVHDISTFSSLFNSLFIANITPHEFDFIRAIVCIQNIKYANLFSAFQQTRYKQVAKVA